ncbi:MAG TPA: hypothetical protein VHQ42_04230 [Candidatus Limnocylindria bacterium]|nr:hypothetical protein [Candidatus Limnocylindria bacterium]
MATPKPGEIRCPTCHRSTPPAAFCTQCGSAIPADARARPRGMDRDELQDRIRARRSGGEPFRRGGVADEPPGYERFEPEPEDSRARRAALPDERRRDHFGDIAAGAGAGAGAAAAGAAGAGPSEPEGWPSEPRPTGVEDQPSLTRDRDEWLTPTAPSPPVTRAADPATQAEPVAADEMAHVDNFDDEAYDYEYDAWEEPEERRSGTGALAILGFLALGVLALLGGALLGGVFDDPGGGVGQVSPTPSPAVTSSAAPSASASAAPSQAPSTAPSGSPGASGGPIVFPDGFAAEAQPCLPGSATGSGCSSNAAINSGAVQIWVGFDNGTDQDVIGAALIGPEGNTLGTGSIDLVDIDCGANCSGYTYFNFSNLEPGAYQVEVTRNGEPAASTSFTVE